MYFPTPEQYSYFLIAPTLIFRNHYPRNEKIRIFNIAYYFALWLLSLYNWFFIFKYHFSARYENLSSEPRALSFYLGTIPWGFIIGPWFAFVFQSMYFHSWCNLAAEVTSFADRQFHLDWWYSFTAAQNTRQVEHANYELHQRLHSQSDLPMEQKSKFGAFRIIFRVCAVSRLHSLVHFWIFRLFHLLDASVRAPSADHDYIYRPYTDQIQRLMRSSDWILSFSRFYLFLSPFFTRSNITPVKNYCVLDTKSLFDTFSNFVPRFIRC